MWTAALTLLNMIPGISNLLATIAGKWMDTKAAMYSQKMGVTKEVAIEAIRAQSKDNETKVDWLKVVAGSRFLQCIVGGFAFPLIVYMNKAYVWDNIVHKFIWGVYGYTPPLTGLVADWGGIIISGIFVTSTGMVAAGAFVSKASKEL